MYLSHNKLDDFVHYLENNWGATIDWSRTPQDDGRIAILRAEFNRFNWVTVVQIPDARTLEVVCSDPLYKAIISNRWRHLV